MSGGWGGRDWGWVVVDQDVERGWEKWVKVGVKLTVGWLLNVPATC